MAEADRASIEQALCDYLTAHVLADGVPITADTPFDRLGLDSLTAVELTMQIEQQFGIPMPPSVLTEDNLRSVRALADCALAQMEAHRP